MGRKSKIYAFEIEGVGGGGGSDVEQGGSRDGGGQEAEDAQMLEYLRLNAAAASHSRASVDGGTGRPRKRASHQGRRTSIAKVYSNVDPAMQNAGEPRKMMSTYIDYEDEDLGDAFDETPWVPPTIAKAEAFRDGLVYRGGKSSIWGTRLRELEDMGIGVSLYFKFLKMLCGIFAVLTALSVPALCFTTTGGAMVMYRDVSGFYRFFVANIGLPCEADTGMPALMTGCNATAYTEQTLYGTSAELLSISYGIASMEFIGCVFFLAMVFLWRFVTDVTVEHVDEAKCTATDYAVQVEGLPRNATQKEVATFFSDLYQLEKDDFKGRAAQEGSLPVQTTENTKDAWFTGKWVAEVELAHAVGKEVVTYKKKRDQVLELRRNRARAKMYSTSTPLLGGQGADPKLRDKFVTKADEVGGRIAQATETIMHARAKLNSEAACVGAFVTFNNPLSLHRCLQDYSKTYWMPGSYPPPMLYGGKHKLRVFPAPEPDNIVWENLEVPKATRWMRRKLTGVVSFILLAVSFTAIVMLANIKDKYSEEVPDLAYCSVEVPAAFLGDYAQVNEMAANPDEAVYIVRPPIDVRTAEGGLDAQCVAATADATAFYAVFSKSVEEGGYLEPIVTYDMDACGSLLRSNECPSVNDPAGTPRCPCVSAISTERCDTLTCSNDPALHNKDACDSYIFSTVAGCYCSDRLTGAQADGAGVMDNIQSVQDEDQVCEAFLQAFLVAGGLSVIISASTPIINALLKTTLRAMVLWQRGTNDDDAATRIMSSVFVAQFINTALLMLLVFGRPPNNSGDVPDALAKAGIFNGPFDDMTRAWFGTVGVQICTSLVLAAILPHVGPLLQYFVVQPLKRRKARHAIERGSAEHPMQHDLNQIFIGPQFDFTTRYSYLLTILFVGMAYGAAIPFMAPLLLIVFFGTYWIDKALLLRYYRRPPHRGDALQQRVNYLLPISLMLRLGFACWVYAVPSLLMSEDVMDSLNLHSQTVESAILQLQNEYGWLLSRILRTNVFPVFLLWIAVTALCLFELLKSVIPGLQQLWWLLHTGLCCTWACQRSNLKIHDASHTLAFDSPWTSEVADFTGVYFKYTDSHGNLTTEQKMEGWMTSTLPGGAVVFKKGWDIGDSAPEGRDAKFTWEVIADNCVHTYDIERIPGYAEILAALREEERLYQADQGVGKGGGGGDGGGDGEGGTDTDDNSDSDDDEESGDEEEGATERTEGTTTTNTGAGGAGKGKKGVSVRRRRSSAASTGEGKKKKNKRRSQGGGAPPPPPPPPAQGETMPSGIGFGTMFAQEPDDPFASLLKDSTEGDEQRTGGGDGWQAQSWDLNQDQQGGGYDGYEPLPPNPRNPLSALMSGDEEDG